MKARARLVEASPAYLTEHIQSREAFDLSVGRELDFEKRHAV